MKKADSAAFGALTDETLETSVRTAGESLKDLVNRDRLARRMGWKDYAKFLGVGQATIYKIARGVVKKAHDTTDFHVREQIRNNPA